MPAAGGESVRIRKDGFRPHFGARDDRVFFMTQEPEDKRALRSIGTRGGGVESRREVTHVTSEAATEFRVAPDGRWLAFTERFNAYVTPFPSGGKTVELGPETKAIPVRQVSRDAGEYLRWSGDSQTLHWSLGPELFRRDLKDAFAFLEGAPEELPEPAERGTAIGFSVPGWWWCRVWVTTGRDRTLYTGHAWTGVCLDYC